MNYYERERVQSRILAAANIVAITAHSWRYECSVEPRFGADGMEIGRFKAEHHSREPARLNPETKVEDEE